MAETTLLLALAGTAAAAAGTAVSGVAQANQAEFQAEIAKQQAARERALAERQEKDFRRAQSRLTASSRARRAASGLSGAGSSLLVEENIAAETELGALDILNSGLVSATRLQQEARLQKAAGRAALVKGGIGAASTLLTGVPRDRKDFG